jgi:hypothetical protein
MRSRRADDRIQIFDGSWAQIAQVLYPALAD